ncbi:hypothetical protein THRCLA_00956 [Thraustotheca clavata]|uniref:GPI transamidase subunit PIG-U n=1 Tax=Thraustotheca clavata TaxID=74557 RepID=A0A1W0AA23_9STRA|nr:hypothetical protein THRCLA_00956 [Thraustotheca clavata]
MTKDRIAQSSVGVIAAGIFLRVFLFTFKWDTFFHNRQELITPLNSIERLQEGLFLANTGLNPYAGDVFHQPPLLLLMAMTAQTISSALSVRFLICFCSIVLDVVIAFGFGQLCREFIQSQRVQQSENSRMWLNHPPLSPLLQPDYLPVTVVGFYLFNPHSLATSLAFSTSLLTYATTVWSLVFAMKSKVMILFKLLTKSAFIGHLALAIFLLSIATYLNVYPCILLPALILMAYPTKPISYMKWLISGVLFLGYVALFLYLSHVAMGNWNFLHDTYLWIVQYPDLTPNIGLFWYFFTELFDRFRNYFLFILHIHPFLYVVPIYIRLRYINPSQSRTRPLAAVSTLLGIFAVFQAYPSFGDFGFFITSCLLHPRSIIGMQQKFIMMTGIAVATVLLPTMWYLWLYPGSGNSNFFYNQTLVYQLFVVKITTEFLTATLRRDKQLQEFWKTKED